MTTADLLRRLPGDKDLEIEVSCGIEHWRGGEITLTVNGSGAVDVRHRRSGVENHYPGRLSPEELSALAERFAELGFATRLSERTDYQADEMTVTMALRGGGGTAVESHVPEGDRYEDDRVGAIVDEYEALVERFTDGALPHGEAAAPL